MSKTQVETPNQGNDTLTNVNSSIRDALNDSELRLQLLEPSQTRNQIQARAENFQQKNNDRIMKKREEMENKLNALLKEIKSNKSASLG